MGVLLEVPMGAEPDDGVLLVEVDRADIPGELVLAARPEPGVAAAKATRTLAESLGHLEPLLRTVKEKLVAIAPDDIEVEFGVKIGGEAGIILAKGTADVHLTITMKWSRGADSA